MTRRFNVVGAVIVRDGLVLAAKRGLSGSLPNTWEFPGGKVEAGESKQEALAREIREELLVDVHVGDEILSTTHGYEFGIVTLTTYYCKLRSGVPQPTEHTVLRRSRRKTSLRWTGRRPTYQRLSGSDRTFKPAKSDPASHCFTCAAMRSVALPTSSSGRFSASR